jgi:hypothetical protein
MKDHEFAMRVQYNINFKVMLILLCMFIMRKELFLRCNVTTTQINLLQQLFRAISNGSTTTVVGHAANLY